MELELDLQFSAPAPVVDEPGVLEYAREHGICVDYTTELPRLCDVARALGGVFDWDLRGAFEDDFVRAGAAARGLARERLGLGREAAVLLKSVLALRGPLGEDALAADARRTRGLKQELPILRTDVGLDMLGFGRRVVPDFADLRTRLPSEDVDEENDEGWAWPARYYAYPARCDAEIGRERLAVTKGALRFLQDAVADDFTPRDGEELMAREMERRSVGALALSGMSADMCRFVLSDT